MTHVDLAPTLLSLCGVAVPSEMQGTDLSHVVLGKTEQGPDTAFLQIFTPFAGDGTPRPWRGVRTSRFLYARTEAGPWLLYDLQEDPYELRNLAQDPNSAALRERMETRLATCMKRIQGRVVQQLDDPGGRPRAALSLRDVLHDPGVSGLGGEAPGVGTQELMAARWSD